MTLVTILAHLGIAAGCGAVVFFFLPSVCRAARVGYGLHLHWSMFFAVVFFLLCGFLHFLVAWQLMYAAGSTLHLTLATGVNAWITVLDSVAMFGTFLAVIGEVAVPFSRGYTQERDEEFAVLARTIVRATREMRTESIE